MGLAPAGAGIITKRNKMAGKKRSFKTNKNTFNKKRRLTGRFRKAMTKRRNPTVPRTNLSFGLGLPEKATVTHRYCDTFTLTSTAGIYATTRYAANGMFDPYITGGGHQPMYYDQFSALYDHYTVIGAKMTVKFVPQTATQTAVYVGILMNDDVTTAVSQMSALMEQNNGRAVRLIAPGQSNNVTLVKKWSAKKIFGGSVLANNSLQGDQTSNPSELSFFDIAVQGVGATDATVNCLITIEYIAVWKELRDVAQS